MRACPPLLCLECSFGFDLSEEYKKIGENNLSKVESDSKVGDCWISYHLGEVRTIRDKDWEDLKGHFDIPANMKDIDFVKVKLTNKNKNIYDILNNSI